MRLLQIVVKEIVVENTDVTKGLIDYINNHCVTNVVLGASSRSALGRLLYLNVNVSVAYDASLPKKRTWLITFVAGNIGLMMCQR